MGEYSLKAENDRLRDERDVLLWKLCRQDEALSAIAEYDEMDGPYAEEAGRIARQALQDVAAKDQK